MRLSRNLWEVSRWYLIEWSATLVAEVHRDRRSPLADAMGLVRRFYVGLPCFLVLGCVLQPEQPGYSENSGGIGSSQTECSQRCQCALSGCAIDPTRIHAEEAALRRARLSPEQFTASQASQALRVPVPPAQFPYQDHCLIQAMGCRDCQRLPER